MKWVHATGPARVAQKAMMREFKHAKPVHSESMYVQVAGIRVS